MQHLRREMRAVILEIVIMARELCFAIFHSKGMSEGSEGGNICNIRLPRMLFICLIDVRVGSTRNV